MSELTLKKLKSILSQKTLIPQSSALKIVQIKKRSSKLGVFLFELFIRDREGIRTPNPQSRNLIFYPVELRSLI